MEKLTGDILIKLCPGPKKHDMGGLAAALTKAAATYDILSTKQRVAMFLAQCAHESGGFSALKENLNYSADGLLKIFPKYFDATTAAQYARNPEKIANKVYASRMGNGPEASGDGWKFRGRGLLQTTGCNNYTAVAKEFKMTVDEVVAYLDTYEGAAMSAGLFWHTNGLNAIADIGDVVEATKKINGGTHGLEDRKRLYEAALILLK